MVCKTTIRRFESDPGLYFFSKSYLWRIRIRKNSYQILYLRSGKLGQNSFSKTSLDIPLFTSKNNYQERKSLKTSRCKQASAKFLPLSWVNTGKISFLWTILSYFTNSIFAAATYAALKNLKRVLGRLHLPRIILLC